jgi:hypothetical protein
MEMTQMRLGLLWTMKILSNLFKGALGHRPHHLDHEIMRKSSFLQIKTAVNNKISQKEFLDLYVSAQRCPILFKGYIDPSDCIEYEPENLKAAALTKDQPTHALVAADSNAVSQYTCKQR